MLRLNLSLLVLATCLATAFGDAGTSTEPKKCIPGDEKVCFTGVGKMSGCTSPDVSDLSVSAEIGVGFPKNAATKTVKIMMAASGETTDKELCKFDLATECKEAAPSSISDDCRCSSQAEGEGNDAGVPAHIVLSFNGKKNESTAGAVFKVVDDDSTEYPSEAMPTDFTYPKTYVNDELIEIWTEIEIQKMSSDDAKNTIINVTICYKGSDSNTKVPGLGDQFKVTDNADGERKCWTAKETAKDLLEKVDGKKRKVNYECGGTAYNNEITLTNKNRAKDPKKPETQTFPPKNGTNTGDGGDGDRGASSGNGAATLYASASATTLASAAAMIAAFL